MSKSAAVDRHVVEPDNTQEPQMKYMCLIYTAPDGGPQTEEEMTATMPEWFAFNDRVEQAGQLISGDALQATDTATTVRIRDGATITTDGPFAETKEHLGGYYLLECDNLDDAIGRAAEIPAAKWGSIEVRPVMDLPQP